MRVLIKVISIHFPIMQQLLPARQLEITTAYHSISERSLLSTGRSQFDAQTWNCIPNIRCTLERASAEVFKSKFAYNLLNPSFFHHHLTSIRLEKLANNRMSQKTDKNVSKCLRRQKKKAQTFCFSLWCRNLNNGQIHPVHFMFQLRYSTGLIFLCNFEVVIAVVTIFEPYFTIFIPQNKNLEAISKY